MATQAPAAAPAAAAVVIASPRDVQERLRDVLEMSTIPNNDPGSETLANLISIYGQVGEGISNTAQLVYDGTFIQNTIESEMQRMDTLSLDARRNVYQLRHLTLAENYDAEYGRFVTHILLFTAFVTMLCLTVFTLQRTDVLPPWLSYTFLGIILVVYAIIMLLTFDNVRRRARNDWDQLFFKPTSDILSEAKLKN